MADTTMDIHIGTQVITTIAEGSTATGIIATAVGIIIEEVTTTHRFLSARIKWKLNETATGVRLKN
jgi:hypothetical protein